MAITRIGFTSNNTNNVTSMSLNVPSGTVDGDVILFMSSCDGNGYSMPSGFTQIYGPSSSGGNSYTLGYRVASSEPASYTINTVSGNERGIGYFVTYRGVDTGTTIDNSSESLNTASSANVTFANMTPNTDNCLVVAFAGHESGSSGGSWVSGWPANFTEIDDNTNGPTGSGSGSSSGAFAEWQQTTASQASGSATGTTGSDDNAGYFIALRAANVNINIDSITPSAIDWNDTGIVIGGFGFNAIKGSGKVEIWSDLSGTTKVEQTTTLWGDTSITFNADTQGALGDDTTLYVVVTSSDPYESSPYAIQVGDLPYATFVATLSPDIYYRMQGDWVDYMGNHSGAGVGDTVGTPLYDSGTQLTRGSTQSWNPNGINTIHEIANSAFTNSTSSRTMRFIGIWVQFDKVYETPTCFWEEGGGVNNFYFAIGFGNSLIANGNDDGQWSAQSYADYKLSVGRPYFLLMRFEGNGFGNLFTLYVNGVRVQQDVGDNPDIATMVSHSGGLCFNKPDRNLDTGGTDIVYTGLDQGRMSDWMTFSDLGLSSSPLTDAEIRSLFVQGVIPEYTVSGTEAAIQTTLDGIAPEAFSDVGCAIRIKVPSDQSSPTFDLDSITFDDRVDIQIIWDGTAGQTLTLVNNGTSNVDAANCETPNGGSIVVQNPATLTVNGLINGCEIRLYDDLGGVVYGTELLGQETLSGTTIQYSHDGTTNDIIIQMIASGYVEVKYPFQVNSSDQTVTIVPEVEEND